MQSYCLTEPRKFQHPRSICHYKLFGLKPVMLAKLFGGQKEHPSQLLPVEIDAESELMQALAEVDKDKCLDDRVVEILSTLSEVANQR